jgi:RNA polymerase sigma-70 factor (ECF subfamily)
MIVLAAPITTGLTMVNAETPNPVDNKDRRWGTWMAAAQAGDRTVYETLLRDCTPFIKTVARRQGVPANYIDDVVQETLLTVHRARRTYDPNRSFSAWLRTIAQRRAIDGLRRQSRNGVCESHVPFAYENHPDPSRDPEEAADRVDRTVRLGSAVSTLPASQREAVQHLALRGQSLAEAAAATGRTPGALKVNLHRALKTLRAQLGGKD